MENPIVHYFLRILNKLSYKYKFFSDIKNCLRQVKYSVLGKTDIALVIEKIQKSRSLQNPVKIVFDVGAAVGDKTTILLKAFPQAMAYAFEPQKESFNTLKKRTSCYGNRVQSFNFGFSNRNDTVSLHVSSYRDSSSILPLSKNPEDRDMEEIKREEIQVMKIDDFTREQNIRHIDFMKIDVEGAEREVLEGGKETFTLKVDNVFLEIFDQNNFPIFLKFFNEAGFTFVGHYTDYFFSKDKDVLKKHSALSIEPKVLVCAYSCLRDPDQRFGNGGESFLGWEIANQLSRFNKIWVLTHHQNREAIEQKIQNNHISNITSIYIKLPAVFDFLQHKHGGIQIYAYLWQIKAYFVAKKLHRAITFDAFHHVTYANDWMASFIGALLPVPYLRGPGGGAHRIPKSFLKSFKQRFTEQVRSFGQWLFRHDPFFIMGQNRAKVILVCNQEAFDALPKKWQEKTLFFPVNGISKEDFGHVFAKKDTHSNFLVTTAGKLLKLKNFDLAIRAFKIFHDKFPASVFSIVGSGPELANLQILAKELNIEKSVIFEGWLVRETLLEKISKSDVFLFPSLRDGGGQVVVEAMAQGKPVICFDISGPGFHIKKEWGVKVKPENPNQAIQDMAFGLEKLYRDQILRETLGQLAKKRVEEFYIWDKLGDQLHQIYNNVLN